MSEEPLDFIRLFLFKVPKSSFLFQTHESRAWAGEVCAKCVSFELKVLWCHS